MPGTRNTTTSSSGFAHGWSLRTRVIRLDWESRKLRIEARTKMPLPRPSDRASEWIQKRQPSQEPFGYSWT